MPKLPTRNRTTRARGENDCAKTLPIYQAFREQAAIQVDDSDNDPTYVGTEGEEDETEDEGLSTSGKGSVGTDAIIPLESAELKKNVRSERRGNYDLMHDLPAKTSRTTLWREANGKTKKSRARTMQNPSSTFFQQLPSRRKTHTSVAMEDVGVLGPPHALITVLGPGEQLEVDTCHGTVNDERRAGVDVLSGPGTQSINRNRAGPLSYLEMCS